MTWRARSAHVLATAVVLGAALVWSAGVARADGRVPMPNIPKAQGGKCIADPAFMRRNHMTLLLHQREATVRLGERKPEFKFEQCLTCHAVKGADGKPVSYSSPKHFCRSCHDYAAVSIDCFECHSSQPEPKAKAASLVPTEKDTLALLRYLRDKVR